MSIEPYDAEPLEVDLRQLIEDQGYEVPDQMAEPDDWGTFHDPRYGRVESASSPPNVIYINEAGVREEVLDHWYDSRAGRRFKSEVASVIERWSQDLSGVTRRQSIDVFNRTRWEGRQHIFAQMSQCAWAVEHDDVLSTLADVLEGLMWQKCRFELFDTDQQSVWNQWAKLVNLDECLRKISREVFKVSQVYVGLWWEEHVFQVEDDPIQGTIKEMEDRREEREYEEKVKAREEFIAMHSKTPGYIKPPEIPEPEKEERRGNRSRRKRYPLRVPTKMTVFDPTKVVPVGTLMFGRERFAYVADRGEDESFGQIMQGDIVDGTVLQLVERKYVPTESDRRALQEIGVDPNRLWLLREDAVFRHTLTRADYERWAAPRLEPVLEILEMKQHLRASDRSALVGNTNFIVLIKKGTDKLPAKPAEIANLQEQARVIARLPVLVGDHRLSVEIISPDLTNILQDSRWQVLDSRLVFAALRTYAPTSQGGNAQGTGISEMSRVVSTGLMNRRHMIVRTLEAKVFSKILEKNPGVRDFDESPSLAFSPKKISLDFEKDVMAAILKLRDRGDISRETTLEELDFDQDVEVLRRARERVDYDRVFESQTPFSSPAANPYGTPQPPGNPLFQAPGQPPQGQPPKEGGRPPGVAEEERRNTKGSGKARAKS